jgi:hypothetical protein
MEIWHRVSINGDAQPDFKAKLDKLGIKYKVSPLPGHKIGLIYFDIAESDLNWSEISPLIQEQGVSDIYDTVFSHKEILKARWCRLIPTFEQGYPEPKTTWLKNPNTYEGVCSECGVYEKQRASFRIGREPKLGKNSFMSLYWTDGLFAAFPVLEKFGERRFQGYEVWDVLIHETGQASKMIAQIYLSNLTTATMIPEENLGQHICNNCGTIKYLPHMWGHMHFSHDLVDSSMDLMLTREWFGDGHTAFREILVSKRVARLIIDSKWQGVRLKPIKPT